MGMSASQARMLSLTSRMSDLELQAQAISNSKIRLADESEAASRAYSDALDKQKLTVFSGVDQNSNSTYLDATANNLTAFNPAVLDHQRFIKDSAGRVLLMGQYVNAYKYAGSPTTTPDLATVEKFLNYLGYTADPTKNIAYNKTLTGNDPATPANETSFIKSVIYDAGAVKHYTNMLNEIIECGYNSPGDTNMNNPAWLQAQVKAGNIFLSVFDDKAGPNGNGDFVDVSWTSGDASIQEKDDKTDLARAEAKYETTMADIQSKDKRFDLQLKEIDTEHNAIQTEVDSVKKVLDKNIERSFKTFNA